MSVRIATRISTATTTLVQTGPCKVYGVVIGSAVANGNVTLIDGLAANGAVKGRVLSPATLLQNHVSLDFHGAQFATGLTVVTAGAQEVTIIHGPID